ncbi:MAG: hypothetical protein V4640_06990 [Verrucomicrobiota bacterium]
MFNPLSDTRMPLSSRIALSGALLLAGVFGLGAALVLPVKNLKKEDAGSAMSSRSEPSSFAETPPAVLPPGSTDGLVKFCAANVSEARSFVVFRNGSAVIINEPCKDPLAEARAKLDKCSGSDVRFVAEPTREGDLIVTFKEPVFHRFSGSDIDQLSLWLSNNANNLLTPDERNSINEGWSPNRNARFGLLARSRMLEDATNPVPVRIIRAKSRAVAAN